MSNKTFVVWMLVCLLIMSGALLMAASSANKVRFTGSTVTLGNGENSASDAYVTLVDDIGSAGFGVVETDIHVIQTSDGTTANTFQLFRWLLEIDDTTPSTHPKAQTITLQCNDGVTSSPTWVDSMQFFSGDSVIGDNCEMLLGSDLNMTSDSLIAIGSTTIEAAGGDSNACDCTSATAGIGSICIDIDGDGSTDCGGLGVDEKSWSFESATGGGGGTTYAGGFYDFASTDDDFNPLVNFGTANGSYAAHVIFVCAAGGSGGTDTVVRITGTSITDTATRTAADTQDITMDDAGAAGAFYESSKKWIGQISLEKQSGPDLLCNYGWAKYWNWNDKQYTVQGVEVTWFASQTDGSVDIELLHHKSSGWTYNAASTPTVPTAIASLQGDHVTEYSTVSGEHGSWQRSNLSTAIDGDGTEGVLWRITATAARTFEYGTAMITVNDDVRECFVFFADQIEGWVNLSDPSDPCG